MGDCLCSGSRFAMTCQKPLTIEVQACLIKPCTVEILPRLSGQEGLSPGKSELNSVACSDQATIFRISKVREAEV